MTATFPVVRLRRLRAHPVLRDLVRESHVHVSDLVFPLFVKEALQEKTPILSMPGIFQLPLHCLEEEIQELKTLGISSVMLFGIPVLKDPLGSASCHHEGIIQRAIEKIHAVCPDMLVMVDLCMCEYTDHGHCGIVHKITQQLDNDKTLEALCTQAVSLAQAGADVIAPSGMIDGMVYSIRRALDLNGFTHLPILSYSVKYNSSFYGPFRLAAEGAPQFGDRSSHQLDTANVQEALREASLDVQEGADLLMVKPAHAYLDVIYRVKQAYPLLPLGAYHTSGEFALLKAAAERGWVDERRAVTEVLRAIRRAGADFIFTYYAKEFAQWSIS